MLDKLNDLEQKALRQIKEIDQIQELNDLRIKLLGRKGELTQLLRGLKDLPPDQRAQVGQAANQLKEHLENMLQQQNQELKSRALNQRLQEETIDVTLPGISFMRGSKHPLTQIREEIQDIFIGMGFTVAEGPEVELDYYNFEALNIPKDHPARDMQDSFYIDEDVLLRTHTSPVQVRTMESMAPRLPVKIIV
ncbi:MAG TPA: phenylalanine--tRNA ligase subunit alpha, partial [Syntrophomonadaceae bacterium]|nr:phenylalanine--tRNA ligase subunit alpha [Syntrophomonadaceae bacterium]